MSYKYLNRQLYLKRQFLWILMIAIFSFLIFNPIETNAFGITGIKVTNISYKGFTVSWVSDGIATGGIRLYEGTDPGASYEVIGDVRGDSYEGYTHYVDLKEGLSPSTTYYFAVECGGTLDDNNSALYTVKTAPPDELPPPANDDCAAGYIKDINGNSIDDAIIYLKVKNGSGGESSELSCYSVNGIWLIPLAPSRVIHEVNAGGYFSYSYDTDHICIYVRAGLELGSAPETLAINQSYGITLIVRAPGGGDITPPQLSITDPNDNEHVRSTMTISGSAWDESGIESVSVKIGDSLSGSANGKESWSYVFDTTQVTDSTYIITVTATDASINANQGDAQISIVVDNTSPLVDVSGINHGAYYNHSVQPLIEITENHLQSSEIKLNGNNSLSGQSVTADGSYTLTVSAQDKAGNSAGTAHTFVIDRVLPYIDISGVDDGGCYQDGVTPSINISDENPDAYSTSSTLNGNPYVSGTPITADGSYTLMVSTKDKANNLAEESIVFQVGPCDICRFTATITATGQDVGGGVSKESSVTLGIIDGGYEVPALSDPMGGFTVRMVIVGPDKDLSENYKTAWTEYESWLFKIFINDSYANDQLPGYYPTLVWNPEDFNPEDSGACSESYFKLYLSDPNGRSYDTLIEDMSAKNSFQIRQEHMEEGSKHLYLKFVWSKGIEVNLPAGWSMISLSIEPSSHTYPDIFPGALAVYRFVPGTGYKKVQVDEPLVIEEGYWLYLNQAKSFNITGASISDYSFDIRGDWWHMIGACSNPSTISIDSNSVQNVYFSIYKFVPGTGYKKLGADERLMPGSGYWLWVSENSNVTVQSPEKMMRYRKNFLFNSGPVPSRMRIPAKANMDRGTAILVNNQTTEGFADKDSIYKGMKECGPESKGFSSDVKLTAEDLDENSWEMMITVEGPKLEGLNTSISSVFIGIKGEDYAVPTLPAPMEDTSVIMSIVKGPENLVEDYRASGAASEVWTLRIEISESRDTAQADCYPVLTWDPVNLGPGTMKLVLGDDARDGTVLIDHMKNSSFYQTLDIDNADADGILFYTIIYSPDDHSEVDAGSYQPVTDKSNASLSTIISGGSGLYDLYMDSFVYHWFWNNYGYSNSGLGLYDLYGPLSMTEGFGFLSALPYSLPLYEVPNNKHFIPSFYLPSLTSIWFNQSSQGAGLGYPLYRINNRPYLYK